MAGPASATTKRAASTRPNTIGLIGKPLKKDSY
jgi:hypothetical protein